MLLARNPDLIYSAGDGLTVAAFGYKRGWEEPEHVSYLRPEYVFGACAGAAIYRREVFEQVGLFDEDFYAFIEDLDFSFRAQLQGFRCLYVPSARVLHIGGATFGDLTTRSLYYGYRNRISFITKNLPGRLLLRHLHAILLHTLISIMLYTLKGHGHTLLRAHWDGLKTIPRFLKKRKEVQPQRTVPLDYLSEILDHHWFRIMLRLSRFLKRFYTPYRVPPEQRPARSAGSVTRRPVGVSAAPGKRR
jgi:GT2 family glycosyltransferase